MNLNIKNLENDLIAIAKKVGSKILYYKKNNLIIYKKRGSQVKSNIDIECENLWIKNLKKKYKNLNILSEESYNYKKNIDNTWSGFVIDPIDGTRSLVSNYKSYVTQIAFIAYGKLKYGLIYNPETKEIYSNYSGNRNKFNSENKKLNCIIDNYPIPKLKIKKIINELQIPHYMECGSIGYKIYKILINEAELFIKFNKLKIWDVLPGKILIERNGGVIKDINFKDINLSRVDINGIIVCKNRNVFNKIRLCSEIIKK